MSAEAVRRMPLGIRSLDREGREVFKRGPHIPSIKTSEKVVRNTDELAGGYAVFRGKSYSVCLLCRGDPQFSTREDTWHTGASCCSSDGTPYPCHPMSM